MPLLKNIGYLQDATDEEKQTAIDTWNTVGNYLTSDLTQVKPPFDITKYPTLYTSSNKAWKLPDGNIIRNYLAGNVPNQQYADPKKEKRLTQNIFWEDPFNELINDPRAWMHEDAHHRQTSVVGSTRTYNERFDEISGSPSTRLEITRDFKKHRKYLMDKYGLSSRDPYFKDDNWKDVPFHELMATLDALEVYNKKNLDEDPYIRKHILDTPAKREAFRASTGLRLTRLDARDLPPMTRLPEKKVK